MRFCGADLPPRWTLAKTFGARFSCEEHIDCGQAYSRHVYVCAQRVIARGEAQGLQTFDVAGTHLVALGEPLGLPRPCAAEPVLRQIVGEQVGHQQRHAFTSESSDST